MTPDTPAPPRRPWLAEAETGQPGRRQWRRVAALAPSAATAAALLCERLGPDAVIGTVRPGRAATLDEETALLGQLSAQSDLALGLPLWASVRDADAPAVTRILTAPPPPPDAEGLAVLPARLAARGRLYALLDGAALFGLPDRLAVSGLDWRCLFQGEAARTHADAAPYLVELRAGNALTGRLLDAGSGGRAFNVTTPLAHALFIASEVSLNGLWRHLRKFTMLPGPNGRRLFFRFYDPAVFRAFIPGMAPADLAQFARGMDAIGASAGKDGFVIAAADTGDRDADRRPPDSCL